jgi:endonuclease/exonuclease/phosphatase family metal-dependent hydrolase
VHALCSQPTPPVFDGPEDRNGRRNHDEIRFWVDYLTPGRDAWIVDDQGRSGGLPEGRDLVVLGDLNCDPHDGDARREALASLLAHPRLADPEPRSEGAVGQARQQAFANASHRGDPALDTGDFADEPPAGPGNLRVDYVLPGRGLPVVRCGVLWPNVMEPAAVLVGASDHRLVWAELEAR